MDKSTQNTLLVVGGIAVVLYFMSKNSSVTTVCRPVGGGVCTGVCASLLREACVQAQASALSCSLQRVICSF